jgi:methyl-accepting chemotaxis protein
MALLQEARKDFEKTFSSFSEIIEQYEQKDHAGKKFVFSQTSLKQISMVFLNAQLLNDSLDRLYELCESTTKKTQNIMGFLIVFFTIGGTLMIAVNSAFLNKMLTKRIKTLHEGIEIIGGGNLDYQIDMKGDDELSVLPGS